MVLIKFCYQLVNDNAKSNVFKYQELLDNCEVSEVLEEIEYGGTFSDMYEAGMNCLIRVQDEIKDLVLKATNFNNLQKKYGTKDPFDVFDLRIDFDPEIYQNRYSLEGDDE